MEIFRSRWVQIGTTVVVAYLGLWGATQWFGVPRVRAAVSRQHLPPPEKIRRPDQVAECTAVAVAPFLIKAAYYWHLGPLIGEGGAAFHIWFGGSGLEIWAEPTFTQ